MYLKRIKINGFKSFADETTISLTDGITCIVGPNGCGKSNIVDAIRWVLGEQSAKALRGGKMQDVIFQGTETRKPLQFCEVSLLFSDCEKQLGTNFNEVEITRKVSRDGGSDYFINGKAGRLKDIQSLFMDTGIGRVSYSFMVQGQIDQILSSNPGERRAIFEEAAGITKYKTQRREALNKLALVDQNLARATDRIEEISRQIGTLKRQASKALRYKRLSHRLRHLDLALNAKSYAEQSAELARDAESLKEVSAQIFSLTQRLSESEESLSAMRSQRAAMLAELETMRQNAAETRSAKEQAQRSSEFAQVRKKDLEERLSQISKELETLREQLSALEGKAKGDAEVKQMQLELVMADDEVFKQQAGELTQIEESIREAESALSRAKQDALVNDGTITRLRSNCTTLELDLKSYQVRHAALSDSIFQIKEESQSLERRILELAEALDGANERLGEADADVAEQQSKIEELRRQYRDKQAEIQQADRAIASKAARLGLLNDFQSRMEGFSDGIKSIMKGALNDCLPADSAKIVSQHLEVEEGWTSAFETLMGPALDAASLPDASELSKILAALRERNLGKACFQLAQSAFSGADFPLPPTIKKAADVVKCQSEDIAKYARNAVAGCYFCEDISDFAKFVSENPEFKFFCAVARDGSMLDARGTVYASTGEKRDTESSFLLRASEIKRLKSEIDSDNDNLTALNEAAMALQSMMDAAESEIENKKNAAAEIKREISAINAQTNEANSQMGAKETDLQRKNAEMQSMETSRFEVQDRLDRAQKALEEAESAVESSKRVISEREAELAELREAKDARFAVLSETRIELASKKSRLENLERGLGAIKVQQAEAQAAIERRESESQSIRAQIENLERETSEETERAAALAQSLETALEEIEAFRVKLSAEETRLSEYETSLVGLREEHMRASAQKSELDVRSARLRSKLDYISERILNDYEVSIATADWKRELWKADEEFETKIKLDELEDGEIEAKSKGKRGEPTEEDFAAMDSVDFAAVGEEVRELRERISAMGAVNLVAIEEYAELKERYDFLKAQTDDLWASKNALIADIDEINSTSQKLFSETFEQIRKNFSFTFDKIFGGGTADLNLVESEDVLDSGIEIVARPPGTVLKSLSLLSGGQRTMTAVSLLFAIYMVKPSPFCVLDELDAPLDDANIGRYTDMLKEFTRYSQFLVISHNKRTMSAAKTIYGVTMQERGVTRLISMRFNRESGNAETAEADSEKH